ncbi:MAG: hypothetical protein PHI48_11435 [Bacteroidales bacterium]|nr:hypothetical protein [Bacteroidales bacterium]
MNFPSLHPVRHCGPDPQSPYAQEESFGTKDQFLRLIWMIVVAFCTIV